MERFFIELLQCTMLNDSNCFLSLTTRILNQRDVVDKNIMMITIKLLIIVFLESAFKHFIFG